MLVGAAIRSGSTGGANSRAPDDLYIVAVFLVCVPSSRLLRRLLRAAANTRRKVAPASLEGGGEEYINICRGVVSFLVAAADAV